jgi:hypothetical protein
MMKVRIKAKGRRIIIPVPYALLHLFIGVLTSKRILALANQSIEKKGKKNFQIPELNRNDLKSLLRELSNHKGLLLVETILKDGTEVTIRL